MPIPLNIAGITAAPVNRMPKTSTGVKPAEHHPRTDPKLKAACASFESIFLHQLFKQMRATVPESGLLDGGTAEEIYTDMMDGEVSKKLASENGIGLARMLENQLRQSMEPLPVPNKADGEK